MGPVKDVTLQFSEGRAVFQHTCLGERVETTLNNVDWTVLKEDSLTVQPSVHCTRCDLHGWISHGEFWGTPGQTAGGTE